MARPHIEPFCDRDVPFKKMNMKGFPAGMQYKMLSLDTDTGACTMTVQLDAGYSQKPGFSWSELEGASPRRRRSSTATTRSPPTTPRRPPTR